MAASFKDDNCLTPIVRDPRWDLSILSENDILNKIIVIAKTLPVKASIILILGINRKNHSIWQKHVSENKYYGLEKEILEASLKFNTFNKLLEHHYLHFKPIGSLLLLGKPYYCNAIIEIICRYGDSSINNNFSKQDLSNLYELIEVYYAYYCKINYNVSKIKDSLLFQYGLEFLLESDRFKNFEGYALNLEFLLKNKQYIPAIKDAEFKRASLNSIENIMEACENNYSWNSIVQQELAADPLNKNYHDRISTDFDSLVEHIRKLTNESYAQNWYKRGYLFEETIWGKASIKIDDEYFLLPFHNLLLNSYSFNLILDSQKTFSDKFDLKDHDWKNIPIVFENWIFSKYKEKDNSVTTVKTGENQLGDIIFVKSNILFIGDVKLITIKGNNSTSKGIGKLAFGDYKTQIEKIFKQRTDRFNDLNDGVYNHAFKNCKFNKVCHFVVVPDIYDIDHIPNRLPGNQKSDFIKSFKRYKDLYLKDRVNVMFVPYKKVDLMVKNPFIYMKNKKYKPNRFTLKLQ